MVIAVCGNIASGKTTLAKYICQNYKFTYIPKHRIEMEFLQDFFDNIQEFFLPTQLSFLISKAMQIKEAVAKSESIIIDRSLIEDIHVFAQLWMDDYDIDERVKKLYLKTAEYIISSLPLVDLYILCDCSPSISALRLGEREKRDFEKKYPHKYIDKLGEYMQNINYPKESAYARIDSAKWNFQDESVMEKVVEELFERYNKGLEEQYHQINISEYEKGIHKNDNGRLIYIDEYIVGSSGDKIDIKSLKRGRKVVYLAAPFTNIALEEKERGELFKETKRGHGVLPKSYQIQLKRIRKKLMNEWNVDVILPHKDVNAWGNKELSSDIVLKKIVENIAQSDIVVAIPSKSIGVHFEIGIALAQHKPIVTFEVEELENSFYVPNLDVLKGIWRYHVKSISEIEYVLGGKDVYKCIKDYMEEHNDKMDE